MNNERARTIDVPFSRGVRGDVESRTAPPGALTVADNVEFDHQNRLVRRDGLKTLGKTKISKTNVLDLPVRRAVQTPDGARLLFTDRNFFEYYPSADGMTEAGVDSQTSTVRGVLQETAGIVADECGLIDYCDACAVNGYAVYAYAKQNDFPGGNTKQIYLDVVSVKDGARVVTQQAISGAFDYTRGSGQVRCVVSGGGNIAFVLWYSGPATIAYAKVTLTLGAVTVGAATALVTDSDNPGIFDVDSMASGWVLVYGQSSAGHKARIATFDSTPAQTHTYTWLTAIGAAAWQPTALAITGDAKFPTNRVQATGYDPATFRVEIVTLTPALAAPNQTSFDPGYVHGTPVRQMTICRVAGGPTGGSILLFSNYSSTPLTAYAGGPGYPRGHLSMYLVTDDPLAPFVFHFANYSLASKIYFDTRPIGAVFVMARFDDPSGFQNHFLLLDLGAGGAFGKLVPTFHVASGRVPLMADNAYTGIGGIADLSFEEPGLFQVVVRQNCGASQISGNQVVAYTCTSCRSDRFLSTPCQGEAVIGGGTPLTYDGQRLVELSFYSYPVVTSAQHTPAASAGSMAQGIYQYRWVYEWTDAKGNRHQSPASPAATVDMSGAPYVAGTNRVDVRIPNYQATRKHQFFNFGGAQDDGAPLRIVPYRTVAGSSGPFYRLPTAAVNNANTPDPASFTDTYADASISGNEPLYERNGGRGELATTAPPPSLFMTTHQQRLWGLDGEDPERIWATKTLSPLTAPGYSPALQVLIPGAGKICGLAGQDGKLYALATNGIYLASYGDGPDNAGGGAFPSPQLISTDATCDEPRSVIAASNGIYFTGRDKWGTGIYLIRRGDGTPVPIGRRIRRDLETYPVCRGAVDRVDKARAEFLFTVNDLSETGSNQSVIAYYHYDLLDEEGIGQWTIARPKSTDGVGDWTEFECLGIWTETSDGSIGGPPKLDSILATTATAGPGVGAQQAGTIRDFGGAVPLTSIETADIRAFGLTGYGAIRGVTMYGTRISPDPINMEASYDAGQNYETRVFGVPSIATGSPLLFRWETITQKLPDGGMVRLRVNDQAQGETSAGTTWFHGLSIEVEPLGGDARLGSDRR